MRSRKFIAVFFLLILLILNSANAAFSSESVKNIALVYSDKDEAVVVPSEYNPLIYKDEMYWYAYFTPQDSKQKNLVLIIRQEGDNGFLETREKELRVLYSIDFDLETLQFLREQGISFGDLENVIESLRFQIDNVEMPTLENVRKQSLEDFSKIDDALYDLQIASEDTLTFIQEGGGYLENFRTSAAYQEVLIDDLELVMRRHFDTIDSIHVFVDRAEIYKKVVAEKQIEVSDQAIAVELAKLGNLKVKDSVLKSYNASLAQKRKQVEARISRRDAQVNDTIFSLYFRKSKTEAQTAYDRAVSAGLIDSLLSPQNELALKDCGLSNKDLKDKWNAVKVAMDPFQPHSVQEYELVPIKLNEAERMAENLNKRLRDCIGATATPTPEPDGFDWRSIAGPAILVMLAILAFYYLSSYFKKKPEDEMGQLES